MRNLTVTEEMLENTTIASLVEENQRLTAELAKWKPEINIEFNNNTKELVVEIVQGVKAQHLLYQKDWLDWNTTKTKADIIATELADIQINFIKERIAPALVSVDKAIEQLKEKGHW